MKYKVIIQTNIIDSPKNHEIRASLIIANKYFKSDVNFLRQEIHSSPDIETHGQKWEIKNPLGNGKKTIENNLRNARKQSKRIIIDFSRMKLHQTKAISNIKFFIRNSPGQFKKVVVIAKDSEILEIL
jgi:hypothetical protein